MSAAPQAEAVSAVVLGGGQSRRFGREKGLAMWRGRNLVDHVLQRLPHPRPATLLVLRAEQNDTWSGRDGVDIVHDHNAHAGPLRGAIRGLEHLGEAHPDSWAWIVACDQPLISADLLCALLREVSPTTLAVVPEWNGQLQPLSGLYHVDAAAELRACHERGEVSLVGALETVGHRVFSARHCREHDPRGLSFMNVNRPADLNELERMLT
jgi:molybdopterin-guanine dinucleotide biosynthesis protein A